MILHEVRGEGIPGKIKKKFEKSTGLHGFSPEVPMVFWEVFFIHLLFQFTFHNRCIAKVSPTHWAFCEIWGQNFTKIANFF
jgi:hypothetical protein